MPTWFLLLVSLGVSSAAAQDVTPVRQTPVAVLREIHLKGATIFTREDVLWLLGLREGSPLPRTAADIAKELQEAYERDGYSKAIVTGTCDQGRLSLAVEQGRIDEIEIAGMGKMLFHAVLQVNAHLQSVSSEMRTRDVTGRASGPE